MTKTPTVSVIIPAYNAAWCVQTAIGSVLAQDFADYELVVIDDGSTDDTAEILRAYGNRLRVIPQRNGGMSMARNRGIEESKGEFAAFLDADDWWLPGKLSRQVGLMRARPSLGFTATAARVENLGGEIINLWGCTEPEGDLLSFLFETNRGIAGGTSGLMARRELLRQVGGYDEALMGAEDADLWMRLAAITEYACIGEPLVVVLRRPGSVSGNVETMRDGAIRVRHKNRHLLPEGQQHRFWRLCLANVYGDFAKWRYRAGRRAAAILDVVRMLRFAPVARGRLGLGLLKDMMLDRAL